MRRIRELRQQLVWFCAILKFYRLAGVFPLPHTWQSQLPMDRSVRQPWLPCVAAQAALSLFRQNGCYCAKANIIRFTESRYTTTGQKKAQALH